MVAPRRCLWRLALLALVAILPTLAEDAMEGETLPSVVRLGVSRMDRNSEIDRLIAAYELHQRTLAASAVSSGPWKSDQALTAVNLDAETPTSLEAVETRIRSGEGSHTITVFVGGQERELIIDTGSGKTAFICEGCRECGHRHQHEPFRHTNNTKFLSCDPHFPGDPELGGCMSCVDSKCRYGQKYVEGDYWEAYKVTDEMRFPARGVIDAANAPSLAATIEFGCIYAQTGCFNEQTSDGIMGFSRHPDAVYEQFYRQHATHSRIFAQCLAADGGALTIGGVDMHLNTGPVAYTPLRSTGYQYWTVELESISIGSAPLAVDRSVLNSERGCVLDSGTTFVYLPTAAKSAFTEAWRQARGGGDDSLPVSDSYHRLDTAALRRLPPICFHFANAAKLCMKPEAYMYKLSDNEYAGTIFFGDEARSTIVGASALMHHNMIYDVDNNRVGMADANCDAAVVLTDMVSEKMIALELHPGGDTFKIAMPIDRELYAQIALGAVAVIAVAGLLLTIWEEVRRPRTTVEKIEARATAIHDDAEHDAFAFFLMPEEDA